MEDNAILHDSLDSDKLAVYKKYGTDMHDKEMLPKVLNFVPSMTKQVHESLMTIVSLFLVLVTCKCKNADLFLFFWSVFSVLMHFFLGFWFLSVDFFPLHGMFPEELWLSSEFKRLGQGDDEGTATLLQGNLQCTESLHCRPFLLFLNSQVQSQQTDSAYKWCMFSQQREPHCHWPP